MVISLALSCTTLRVTVLLWSMTFGSNSSNILSLHSPREGLGVGITST